MHQARNCRQKDPALALGQVSRFVGFELYRRVGLSARLAQPPPQPKTDRQRHHEKDHVERQKLRAVEIKWIHGLLHSGYQVGGQGCHVKDRPVKRVISGLWRSSPEEWVHKARELAGRRLGSL